MKLLIADLNETNLKILNMILAVDGYDIKIANSFEDLEIKLKSDFDLVLLSNVFSDIDWSLLSDKKVVVMSGMPTVDNIVSFYAKGIQDYIILPAGADLIRHSMIDALVKKKELNEILSAIRPIQVKDNGSFKHLERIRIYAKTLSNELMKIFKNLKIDESFVKNLELASVLHDIGKTNVDDEILRKPDKLTEAEFEHIKTHTTSGFKMLEKIKNTPFVEMAKDIILSHHERYDGTGYPDKKSGEEIPLCARIIALCDVYDALRETRVYKENFSHEKSVEIIKGGKNKQFDPKIIEAFENVQDKFKETFDKLSLKNEAR